MNISRTIKQVIHKELHFYPLPLFVSMLQDELSHEFQEFIKKKLHSKSTKSYLKRKYKRFTSLCNELEKNGYAQAFLDHLESQGNTSVKDPITHYLKNDKNFYTFCQKYQEAKPTISDTSNTDQNKINPGIPELKTYWKTLNRAEKLFLIKYLHEFQANSSSSV